MKKDNKTPDNQITVYQTPDGNINIEVLYANENIWLSQKRMADLFGCSADNISLHLRNIYKEKELDKSATTEDFSAVQSEGAREVNRNVTFYSLEAIIAVGYRVNSERGTQFRQWATTVLQKYIHKGFAIDSDRFKYGSRFSARYFDDLLEEIRDIRSRSRSRYRYTDTHRYRYRYYGVGDVWGTYGGRSQFVSLWRKLSRSPGGTSILRSPPAVRFQGF